MGWSIGYDTNWKRDVGYGVPAVCDHPDCNKQIDRGLSYVCADQEMFGGENGCGLYFCEEHRNYHEMENGDETYVCERCAQGEKPFDMKPDVREWIEWKLKHDSWQQWRDENPDEVARMREMVRS